MNTARLNPFNKVRYLDRLLFTKHLSTMVKAGIPITEALNTLIDQTKSKVFRSVLEDVLSGVENGQSLAKSMAKHPEVFDQFYISLIEVSEESGTLEENLEFMAGQLTKDYILRKKVQGALLYPALIVTAAVVMGGFIALFVLPQLVDFFDAFDTELPITTSILLFVANTMKDYGVFILLGAVVLVVGLIFLLRTPKIKPKWHSLQLKIPLIGDMLAYNQLARFSRNLGVLLTSGISISRSIEVTANTLSNIKFRNDLLKIGDSLTKGKNIAEEMSSKKYSEFPPIVSKMIGVGEKTGKLDETLLYLGDFYEDEIDNLSKNLTTILEPILLIIIGLVVGFVALAIISPIYELTGSIRR